MGLALITRLRMNHAAGMLVREGMSVKQVAIELGYEDPFTFSRRFKKAMGLSPRQFNEKYRNGDAAGVTVD
jgi:AraC family transcriptional regulator of arabinose operon